MSSVIDWAAFDAVEQHSNRVGGAWVFAGTRVPLSALFENLEDGASVKDFVKWFPDVTGRQVREVLGHASRSAAA